MLELRIGEEAPVTFKAECFWRRAGVECGKESFRLSVGVTWTLEFTSGSAELAWRRAKQWRDWFETSAFGQHVSDSLRSKKRRASVHGRILRESDASQANPEWSITIPGLIVIIGRMLTDGRAFRTTPDQSETSEAKLRMLLRGIIDFVCKERTLVFRSSTIDFIVRGGVVDNDSLVNAQAALGLQKRSMVTAVSEEGHAMHLGDFFVRVMGSTNTRWARGKNKFERQQHILETVVNGVGLLWEATKNEPEWDRVGHIALGVQRGASRSIRVPAHFRRAVVYETRSARGQGVATCKQLLIGMRVGRKVGPTQLATMKARKCRRTLPSASSQDQGATNIPGVGVAQKLVDFEMYNYHVDCRFRGVQIKTRRM